jgi:hypothetical protein
MVVTSTQMDSCQRQWMKKSPLAIGSMQKSL